MRLTAVSLLPFKSMNLIKNMSEMPMPAAKIRTLDDGSVRVQVGIFVGTVSSHHLIQPKVHQLQQYWLKAHAAHDYQTRHKV